MTRHGLWRPDLSEFFRAGAQLALELEEASCGMVLPLS